MCALYMCESVYFPFAFLPPVFIFSLIIIMFNVNISVKQPVKLLKYAGKFCAKMWLLLGYELYHIEPP